MMLMSTSTTATWVRDVQENSKLHCFIQYLNIHLVYDPPFVASTSRHLQLISSILASKLRQFCLLSSFVMMYVHAFGKGIGDKIDFFFPHTFG